MFTRASAASVIQSCCNFPINGDVTFENKSQTKYCKGTALIAADSQYIDDDIIDYIHDNRQWSDGIILNAGAFTHYSYAIRDAIESINKPTIEVHLSDIHNREPFRKTLVLSDVCLKTIAGQVKNGYLEALKDFNILL